MRFFSGFFATALGLFTISGLAQSFCSTGRGIVADHSTPTDGEETKAGWSYSALAYLYLVPDEEDFLLPTVTADHGWLHLEARYNYEDSQTGSAWVGHNFSGGNSIVWEVTPMVGAVIGNTTGIAPGYNGLLGWWKLELYSEGEYVVDVDAGSDSFFYNWSELSFLPAEWVRIGFVTQRTRIYQTSRDIQRGLLVGFYHEQFELSGYMFNPDDSKPTLVLAFGLNF